MRRLSVFLAALCAAALTASPASAQTATSQEQIQIWNVSLRLVDHPNDTAWRDAFRQMVSSQYQYKPDLITALEVPFQDQDMVRAHVESVLGTSWGSAHSDFGISFCETNRSVSCGNTLLLWRTGRFTKQEVHRWKQHNDKNGDTDCNDAGDENVYDDQIAARLKDDQKGKMLVFSGVHFSAGASQNCVARNMQKLSNTIDYQWSNRPLTIITGDLNEKVDIHANDTSYSNSHWRRESDTACWYEEFSALHPQRSICDMFSSFYYDAVWAERAGANPSDGICQHWTMGNTIANYSTADGCDSDRTRIDFVWIRYEDGNGNRLDLSLSGIQAKIQAAGADRGYYQTTDRRYSDHRGLHTRVIW